MTSTALSTTNDGFSFLTGRWDVANRQLVAPLTGSDEWREFAASTDARLYLDGDVSVDEMTLPSSGGMSVRLRSRRTNEWFVYWISSRDNQLQPPVRGAWRDGATRFLGEDELDGRPIGVTYEWSDITAISARWQQAFSADGGLTWETNWVMDLTRRPDDAASTEPAPLVTDAFGFREGEWLVRNRRLREVLVGSDDWYEFEGRSTSRTHLGGAVSVDDFRSDVINGFTVRTWDASAGLWRIYWSNADTGELGTPVEGTVGPTGGDFLADEDWNGTPITCRFRWSRLDTDSPRWEQAFSTDGGATWETNWVSDFQRLDG